MDFRGPPTTTDANRLIFLPPFAPLAARCAFTIVLSIKYKLSRDFAASASKIRFQRPAVEPIVRTRVRAVAFGQIAPRDPGPQHVKYCIYDPPVVRARTLPTLRHQRLENRPFLIAEIESHDPPPPAVNHDPCCFSVNYAGTDPSVDGLQAVLKEWDNSRRARGTPL